MEGTTLHVVSIAALIGGTAVHIVKKVVERRQQNKAFSLKEYLVAYPYQTFLSTMAGGFGYVTLWMAGTLDPASAFLAGVAANSLGDIAPGNRND